VEGEFIDSWDQMEKFFSNPMFIKENSDEIIRFIKSLREKGYDHHFRAGQAMTLFLLSRSRRHGLREDQPSICFSFATNKVYGSAELLHKKHFLSKLFPRNKQFVLENYQSTPELESLLQEFMNYPID
jgi:hypothetical protein